MRKKKATKAKATRGIRNLPAKTLTAKHAVGVTGGVDFSHPKVVVEYKPQKADGSLDAGIHFKYDIKG